MSCYIEACGIAPSAAVGSLGAGVGLWESAEVRVNAVGTVEVLTGSHSHGQGHETTFAQLDPTVSALAIDTVSIVHGDTDKVQMGMGTYGSRSGAVGMSAIVKALDKVEIKAKKLPRTCWKPTKRHRHRGRRAQGRRNRQERAVVHESGAAAYTAHNLPEGMEPGLKEGAFYDPSNFTFPAGCYICEVEVDPETGKTEIVQFVAADDFGKIINPMIVEGQVHGGVARASARRCWKARLRRGNRSAADGELHGLHHAARRRCAVVPVSTTETACPGNPLGIKGCGEAGAIGSPPAVINAITDAIGNNDLTMPATPERVWAAQVSLRRTDPAANHEAAAGGAFGSR
jgi:carbon-monoxide dehydrogenase large subunit